VSAPADVSAANQHRADVHERIGRALSGEYVFILGTNDWPECNGLCAQLAKLTYVPESGVIKLSRNLLSASSFHFRKKTLGNGGNE